MDERCRRVTELMPWLLNGRLSSEEVIMTLDHIRECKGCKRELAVMATSREAAQNAWSKFPSPSFMSQLWTRIDGQMQTERSMGRRLQNVLSKRQILGTTLRLVGYCITPLNTAQNAVRITYQSMVREFRHIIGELAQVDSRHNYS